MPDGSGVLVDEASGTSYALNATGAEVWQLCDGRHTMDDIAAALLERYRATRREIRQSVRALVAHLRQLGVLDETAPGSTFQVQGPSCSSDHSER